MESRARRLNDESEPAGIPEAPPLAAALRDPAGCQLTLELKPPRSTFPELADGPAPKPRVASAIEIGTAGVKKMEARQPDSLQRLLDPAWIAPKPARGRCSILGELIEIIGEEAALKLIRAFGGTRLYVPHSPEPNDILAVTIGVDAAAKLARIYGGDRVDVPNPPPRRMRIMQLRAAGMSVDSIARELRCTRRRVFQVLAEARGMHRPA